MPSVSGVHLYPVKSLGAVDVDRAFVEARGLRGDRRMMLVDEQGVFMTQRTFSRLATLRLEATSSGWRVVAPDGSFIDLGSGTGVRIPVRVWTSELLAELVDPEADAWFTRELETPARLVRMPEDVVRPTHPDYSDPGDQVSFADGFPMLVTSLASLADLNGRLQSPLPMNRFRPNLVLSGVEPFEEEECTAIRIRDIRFRMARRCGRCRVPSIDQSTGTLTGDEPLRTLATYRRDGNLVTFGGNFIPDGEGEIAVGDEVFVEAASSTPS